MGPPTCHMGDEHSEITAIARGSVTRVTHSHFCYKKQSRAENLHRFKGRKVCFTRGLHVAYAAWDSHGVSFYGDIGFARLKQHFRDGGFGLRTDRPVTYQYIRGLQRGSNWNLNAKNAGIPATTGIALHETDMAGNRPISFELHPSHPCGYVFQLDNLSYFDHLKSSALPGSILPLFANMSCWHFGPIHGPYRPIQI